MNSLAYVVSTRIRIARNLRDLPFPLKATELQRQDVLERVCHAWREQSCCRESTLLLLDHLDILERKLLEEEHLISHLSAASDGARAAILSKDRDYSILINEEDHLRIQAIAPGMAFDACRRAAHRVERCLHDTLPFAYSDAKGYLTSCSQNSGSGIRTSAMLFLPGLMLLRKLTPLLRAYAHAGYTIRGAYGEGSRTEGYLLQLSLNAPYKQTLQASLDQFARGCRQLIHHERMARMSLLTSSSRLLRRRVRWVKRHLHQAESFSLASALHVIAICRLCVCIGFQPPTFRRTFISGTARKRYFDGFDRLSQRMQAAHIRHAQLQEPRGTHAGIRVESDDELRARVLREGLGAVMGAGM